MSFITGTQAELLYTLSAAVTKNTYTTEAAFSGVAGTNTVCTLPAGWALNEGVNPVGRSLYLKAEGIIANTAAATFAVQLGLDPTAGTKNQGIAVNAAYTPTSAVTAPWHLEAWYTITAFATSTMTLQVNGKIEYESVAAGGAPTTTRQCAGFQGTHAGIDPRVANYIELFGTWSASSASNTTTLHQMLLFGLN
jgi:hypothetical protein